MRQYKVPFNKAAFFEESLVYANEAINKGLCGGGYFTKKCESFLEAEFDYKKAMLVNSCTGGLEICALILKQLYPDKNEIIIPSYTFVSSANAFAKFGFKIRFVDINPNTMNVCEEAVEAAISDRTCAVVAVNYGGSSADMYRLQKICKSNNLFLIEDAAQSFASKYNDKYLGSFGDLAALSFHETKNVTSGGEGGALIINREDLIELCDVIRQKGTNRTKFLEGFVDKYTWVNIGGHYLMNELSAAFLCGQLDHYKRITSTRMDIWNKYKTGLHSSIETQFVPPTNMHNAHIFYLKANDGQHRKMLLKFLNDNGICATFHYMPLHSTPAGIDAGVFCGEDKYTTIESEKIIRLPLFYSITEHDVEYVVCMVKEAIKHCCLNV